MTSQMTSQMTFPMTSEMVRLSFCCAGEKACTCKGLPVSKGLSHENYGGNMSYVICMLGSIKKKWARPSREGLRENA